MTEQFLNDMYLIAIKSKLQRNSISTDEKLKIVLEELNSLSENVIVNTNGDNGVPLEPEPHAGCASETSTNVAPQENIVQKKEVPEFEITEKKFAQSPEEEGFLNRDLETSDDGQYYVIELNHLVQYLLFMCENTNTKTYRMQKKTMIRGKFI